MKKITAVIRMSSPSSYHHHHHHHNSSATTSSLYYYYYYYYYYCYYYYADSKRHKCPNRFSDISYIGIFRKKTDFVNYPLT